MSCDVAAAGVIWLAALTGGAPAPTTGAVLEAPLVRISAANPLAAEPLYADIIARAGRLKTAAERLRRGGAAPGEAFAADIDALAALDLKAHLDLAARGTDGDLKCILKGISQDLPRKFAEVAHAPGLDARGAALDELVFLLRDNVEVLTAPPAPPA